MTHGGQRPPFRPQRLIGLHVSPTAAQDGIWKFLVAVVRLGAIVALVQPSPIRETREVAWSEGKYEDKNGRGIQLTIIRALSL